MAIVRILLLILIGISVAMLPTVGGAAVVSKSADTSMSALGDVPCSKATDDCKAVAACALKCFNFCGAATSPLCLLPRFGRAMQSFATGVLHSRPLTPPFRPPAV